MASGPRPIHRFTVRSRGDDPRAAAIADGALSLGIALQAAVEIADVVFVEGDLSTGDRARLGAFLADPLLQTGTWEVPVGGVEITLHPGVTDGAADAVVHAARQLGVPVTAAATARRIVLPAGADADMLVRRLVANPIIEHWTAGPAAPDLHPGSDVAPAVEIIPVRGLTADALARLGVERSLALDPEELAVISDHFTALGRDPTDVELETLAQTWSEHCAHKTFRAAIATRRRRGRPARPAARRHRPRRRAVRALGVRRQRRHRLVHAGHDHRPQGRDPQPSVGRRAVRRRQHGRRRA